MPSQASQQLFSVSTQEEARVTITVTRAPGPTSHPSSYADNGTQGWETPLHPSTRDENTVFQMLSKIFKNILSGIKEATWKRYC